MVKTRDADDLFFELGMGLYLRHEKVGVPSMLEMIQRWEGVFSM